MFDIQSAQILFAEAEKLNLSPKWETDYGLFSIQIKGRTEYVFYSTSLLNTQLHSYLAKNKHVTRIILEKNGFLNIPFVLPKTFAEAIAFLRLHTTIIAKPTLGQHSENVHLIESEEQLKRINLEENILEKYIKGKEYRYLILNGKVIAVHHKEYDTPINDLTRLRRISLEKTEWKAELVAVAIKVAEVLNLKLAAVDFMISAENKPFILEVNSSPGISRFHQPQMGPSINFARMLLQAIIEEIS